MKKELTVRQVCLFLIAFVPVTKLFLMPAIISQNANEDLWISVSICFVIDIITAISILYISFKHNQSFFSLIESTFNLTTAKIIYFLYFVYFIIKAYLPISEQKGYIELTLYETNPTILTLLPIFALSIYFCTTKLRVVGRISDLFFGVSIFALITILVLSYGSFELSALLPVGANGVTNILHGSYRALPWFGDAVFLLFFMGNFNKTNKAYLKLFLSYMLTFVLVVAFIIVFYCTFTSTTSRQLFALTEIAKYKNVINNIGRLDYFATFLILASSVFAVCIPIFFATHCFTTVFNFKTKTIPSIICNTLIFALIVAFSKSVSLVDHVIINYLSPLFFIMGNLIPLTTIFIRRKNEKV